MPLQLPPLVKLGIIYTVPPTPYGGMFNPYCNTTIDYYEGSTTSAQQALEEWKQANPEKRIYKTFGWPGTPDSKA